MLNVMINVFKVDNKAITTPYEITVAPLLLTLNTFVTPLSMSF